MRTPHAAPFATVLAVGAVALLVAGGPAVGQEPSPITVTPDQKDQGQIQTVVIDAGQPGGTASGGGGSVQPVRDGGPRVGGGAGGGGRAPVNPCSPWRVDSLDNFLAQTEPDSIGRNGPHGPAQVLGDAPAPTAAGSYYERDCPTGRQVVFRADGSTPLPDSPPGATGPVAPTVTPAQLAQQAASLLQLSAPTLDRSPKSSLRYQGLPYTWVQLWTWFWTDPATWRPLTQTTTAGAVSATVTARPVALVFDPGNGDAAVSCPGPGRAWAAGDGDDPPASGCGYRYVHVSRDGPFTATVSISWQVSWVGSGATSGTLPPMRTQASTALDVLQIQTVNVNR